HAVAPAAAGGWSTGPGLLVGGGRCASVARRAWQKLARILRAFYLHPGWQASRGARPEIGTGLAMHNPGKQRGRMSGDIRPHSFARLLCVVLRVFRASSLWPRGFGGGAWRLRKAPTPGGSGSGGSGIPRLVSTSYTAFLPFRNGCVVLRRSLSARLA